MYLVLLLCRTFRSEIRSSLGYNGKLLLNYSARQNRGVFSNFSFPHVIDAEHKHGKKIQKITYLIVINAYLPSQLSSYITNMTSLKSTLTGKAAHK